MLDDAWGKPWSAPQGFTRSLKLTILGNFVVGIALIRDPAMELARYS
jgi:hypothetical protein